MFSPTLPLFRALRRLALTTKRARKGYYKGNRTGSMGWHTKHGGYKLDFSKVRTYVVPERLDSFNLTPFVAKRIEAPKGQAMRGQSYLDKWKMENGQG
ncbi:hypothetical protein W97_06288 [Coniosporium apollinis CBS 100218]|uniref:50S ribosomal protein YmL27 n=1 Tax=Coniosporium apollinis (strain CBS 100218) TaxID=1168221 RepID=R7YY61_CONA1|nr:uncharacterized protein W97_06288 [Coniosporium apollinis CBS 100218]EON66885.1 hypothetical protein W97_06288 [Coniosporium apollinis CBS 100218]